MQCHGKGKVIEQTFHQRSTSATSVRKVVFSVDMAVEAGRLRYRREASSVGFKCWFEDQVLGAISRIGPGIRFHVIFFRVFRSRDHFPCLVFIIEIEIQPV